MGEHQSGLKRHSESGPFAPWDSELPLRADCEGADDADEGEALQVVMNVQRCTGGKDDEFRQGFMQYHRTSALCVLEGLTAEAAGEAPGERQASRAEKISRGHVLLPDIILLTLCKSIET